MLVKQVFYDNNEHNKLFYFIFLIEIIIRRYSAYYNNLLEIPSDSI